MRVLILQRFNLLLLLLMLLLACLSSANAQPPAQLQTNEYGYLSNFSSSMAMVIVFLVSGFFLMGFLSIYIRRCADAENNNAAAGTGAQATAGSSRRRGLDPAVIESFPILVYSAVKDLKIGKGALECAVCLSEFDDYETLRLLPKCHHVFHPNCIDSWLAAHVTCPVCRAKLSQEANLRDAEPNSDSDPESSSLTSPIEVGEVRNDSVSVNADENQRRDPHTVEIGNRAGGGGARAGVSGKFPRSHSTGHSLIPENTERYTLRLPEEVRRQLVSSGNNKLRRSTSYDVVLPRFGSSRKGYRYGGGEGKICLDNQAGWLDPWVLWRTPLRSVKMPLDCLSFKAVERSTDSIPRPPV